MDPERAWMKGRLSWSNENLSAPMRDLGPQPQRRTHHSGPPTLKFRHNRPDWDDSVHDLASMRLTPSELARKIASRQSSNIVLARAQLLEQSRRPGVYSPNLPPSLAARLHAARQQSVESILAHSNTTLQTSQKIRHKETRTSKDFELRRNPDPDGAEDPRQPQTPGKQETPSGRTTPAESEIAQASTQKPDEKKIRDGRETPTGSGAKSEKGGEERAKSTPPTSGRDGGKQVDSTHGASTRTSLDHTITMVVNTCRELWQQLEEERLTRERLTQQLQQQGNVITTLTTELLQIQDQQESILREVNDARASGLWGYDDLSGGSSGSTDGGDDTASSGGGRAVPQPISGRHPQRSILRATRTIHGSHMRQQSPIYQTSRGHQSSPHLGLSQLPHHSPRPPHSPRPHRSPSPQSHLVDRSETWSHVSYRSCISKQIRDALTNSQNFAAASDMKSHVSFSKMPHDDPHGIKDKQYHGERQQPMSNKENDIRSSMSEGVMDSTLSELLEKK